ncbi:MAG: hypothetical protein Q7T16_03945 [Candidatus Burarchaeum sp.]|nr:hypothetical protein [Candidatus Burarchaeum sp.]MDO8339783.1 hypothetical protein [Candidatus Burarchaeum sp.]
MRQWAERDEKRLLLMRNAGAPSGPVFTNLDFPPRISCFLFEAKAAMAVPTKYYQGLKVDGSVLRNDWAHDFCRSLAVLEDRSLLLLAQAVASTGTDTLLFYHAVKFEPNEYSFSALGNGRFELSVSGVAKQGRDLLGGREASHTYDFSFMHSPTKPARLSSTSFRASALASTVYGRYGGLAHTTEESVITVAHLEPHPYLLADYAKLGYKSKNEFIDSVSELLGSLLH